jgi:hypothetical protein
MTEVDWRGIRPVPPQKERTAKAALQLLEAFENGTAISNQPPPDDPR